MNPSAGESYTTADGIYLLTHSVGLAPKNTAAYIQSAYLTPWQSNPQDVWPQWFVALEEFRSALAELLHGDKKGFCPQSNVSSGVTKILYSLPRRAQRDTILLTEHDFPSLGYVVNKAKAAGYRTRFIPRDEDAGSLVVWDKYLTNDVHMALVTHVHSNTSRKAPVGHIASLAHQRGIVSIVDIAQSVGIVPIDVTAWQADFVVGSCVKWLCGGSGAGYMWVNPRIMDACEPVDVGWFSHAAPFEFDIHDFRYANDALRFWGGTPAVLPCVVATNSIRLATSIGIASLQTHNRVLNERITAHLDDAALITPRDPDKRGGTLVLHFGDNHTATLERLTAAGVLFDSRATGIRISPHIYTTPAQIDTVIECIDS